MIDNLLLVTIRCVTYNHEAFIRDCLEGFVMQQTNFRFEAIVHDDASTDGTAAIVAEYAAKYPEIIKPIYETENQYSKRDGSLRRIMNAHMHGKYIALCEGDDYWTDPHKLQKQVDFLEANPDFSMCFHGASVHRVCGGGYINLYEYLCSKEYFASDIIKVLLPIPTASVLYRHYILSLVPIHKKFKYGDAVLFYTCLKYGRIMCMSDKMSVYRSTDIGASSKLTADIILEHNIAMKECFPDFALHIDKMIISLAVSIIKKSVKEKDFIKARNCFLDAGNVVGYLRLFAEICSWTFGVQYWQNRLRVVK